MLHEWKILSNLVLHPAVLYSIGLLSFLSSFSLIKTIHYRFKVIKVYQNKEIAFFFKLTNQAYSDKSCSLANSNLKQEKRKTRN